MPGLTREAVMEVVREQDRRGLGTIARDVHRATGYPVSDARRVLRELDDAGLTELVPLYREDDGLLAGRGRVPA